MLFRSARASSSTWKSLRELREIVAPAGAMYRDAHYLVADMRVDATAAARWVPRPLRVPALARASLFTAWFPHSSFGSVYREAGGRELGKLAGYRASPTRLGAKHEGAVRREGEKDGERPRRGVRGDDGDASERAERDERGDVDRRRARAPEKIGCNLGPAGAENRPNAHRCILPYLGSKKTPRSLERGAG